MRHVRRSWDGQAELQTRQKNLALLFAEVPRQVRRGSCTLPHRRAQETSAFRACRHAIYLPDAPGNRSRRPRRLPEMRHGVGADGRPHRRRRPQPRTGRFPAPFLDRRCADRAAAGADHGPLPRARLRTRRARRAHRTVDRISSGNTGSALGRLAFLRSRRQVCGQSQPEHVHADRPGRRRSVSF